jgi:ubiquinone/menaquinone biosynthesis C-methylase UbiE
MKIRESGMPDEKYWESFFDIHNIFTQLQINDKVKDLVEFGSGYGTFTIPAAKIIRGNVYAVEIEPSMANHLKQKIISENLSNIKIQQRDFVKDDTGLPDSSIDYVMLFNILHAENPVRLLKEAFRILKQEGKAGIIHWIYSSETPRGPSMNIRPKPEQCIEWMQSVGFKVESDVISLPPYHYGIVGIKKKDT